MKKFAAIVLSVLLPLIFVSCSLGSNDSESYSAESESNVNSSVSAAETETLTNETKDSNFNLITYNGVEFKVGKVLDESADIKEFSINEKDGISAATFSWNYISNENGTGYADVLTVFYDNSLDKVKEGNQNVLGCTYCQFNTDDLTTKWSYFNSSDNLIYYTIDYSVYDSQGTLIGHRDQSGEFKDSNGNELDITELDPFLVIVENYDE